MATFLRACGLCLLITFLAFSGGRAAAQAPMPAWYFESVAAGNQIPGCVTGMTLAGFELDPQGRPVLAWREENGCGGPPRVFWIRQEAGAWNQREFLSERRFQGGAAADHSHQFALRAGDGNPFFVYADAGQFNEINTYRSDVGAHPNGGVSTYLENIVPPQNCDYTNYSLAFGPNDPAPQWVTGFATCNGQGSLRLNATDIRSPLYSPRGALEVAPDGTRHVLWNTGSLVNYSRFPFGATVPDHEANLIETGNRFGGEVKIAQGPGGVLHAIVRGPDATADWDLGAIVYLRSDDGGTSWSPYEYVDSNDDPSVQEPWNANSDVSMAIDPQGVPAVAFWRWNSELWYAKRDGPGGTWTQQLITALPLQSQTRASQLRFDANGDPIVAFYDAAVNALRLARPAPAGVVFPVDIAVVVAAAPGIAPPGSPATFTIAVTNKGVTNLTAVELSNRLPYRTSLTGAVPPSGPDGRWVFPLVSGDTQTFTVHAALPLEEGTYVDVAEVAAGAEDANPADNSASAAIVIKGEHCFDPGSEDDPACRTITGAEEDLSVTISVLPGVVAPSGTASFAIGVTNLGPAGRDGVLVEAELSPGAAMIDAAPAPSSISGGVTTYAVGGLASGETKWILVRAAAPGSPSPFSVTTRHLNGADADATNDQATANVAVQVDACFVPRTDLVARWRLDGNGNDDIGGRTAALHGATAFAVGQAGQALMFNGSAGHAEVPDAAALRPAAFTIAAWVNPSTMQDWNTVVAKGASGLDGNMVWYDDTYWLGLGFSGYPTLYTYHGFTQETRAQQPLTPGRWYHLAATYDGSVARLYVDGVQVAESTIDQPLYYDINPVPLTIGEDWQGGSAWGAQFVGVIDEVTLHARALSAGDVAAMLTGSSSECEVVLPVDDLIRNGDIETRSQFDAVGAIASPAGSCSATLLSQTVALTAAQCVYNVPLQDLQFRIGAELSAAVATVLIHPQFLGEDGANLAFDVALVKLDAAAVATWPAIGYAAIAEDAMLPGAIGIAVGAGSIGGSWVRASGSLLVTQYLAGEGPIGNLFDDGFIETLSATAANHMFCAKGTGGPLFDAEGRMTGVASFRFVETCAEDGPGYYINLDRLRTWITTSAHSLAVNDPPTLDPIADVTVVAGQTAVVPLVNVTAGPPDEATQELEVIAISSDSAVTGPITYANGQLTFATPFSVETRSAMLEVTVREVLVLASAVTRSFNVTVLGGGNTPPGSDVTVVNPPISVTFTQVSVGGETSYTEQAAGMPVPAGFAFGNPAVWFDITTTAQYVAPIVVCITYAPTQFTDPAAVRLFHFENGVWADRTISVDVATSTACGSVSSLSPFGLFEPEAPPPPPTAELEGRMHGQAGFTVDGVDYDVHFRIAERQIGHERGSISLKVTSPKAANQKKSVDRFIATRIDNIVFSDDPAFTSGRSTQAPLVDSAVFGGIGKWNGVAGYRFEAAATDQGEPGRGRDRFAITIYDASGAAVATAEAVIESGNIQADRLRPAHWR